MIWGSQGELTEERPAHVHDMHELLISLGSGGRQWVNGLVGDFKPGLAYWLPSGSSHYIEASPTSKAQFVFVCFDPLHFHTDGESGIHDLISKLDEGQHYFSGNDPQCCETNLYLAAEFAKELDIIRPYAEARAQALLTEMLVNFYRSLSVTEKADCDADTNRLEELCVRIALHPEYDYRLEATARSLSMSRSKFACRFSEHTGMTFVEFIQTARIRLALRLFQNSSISVSEVADRVGFRNLGHFHQVFKRRAGMTPLKLKQLVKGRGPFPRLLVSLESGESIHEEST